jgi:hypothetical protein
METLVRLREAAEGVGLALAAVRRGGKPGVRRARCAALARAKARELLAEGFEPRFYSDMDGEPSVCPVRECAPRGVSEAALCAAQAWSLLA